MHVTFAGCGDAFGSGGRLNTCFHVAAAAGPFLIDCGATSLVALKRLGLDPGALRAVLVTHFHADHFGGLPFLLLDGRFNARRRSPLTIAGPAGTRDVLDRYRETFFSGSTATRLGFDVAVVELAPGPAAAVAGLTVTTYPADHGDPGGPAHAYRIEVDGRVIAYTGDTAWTPALVEAGRDADLLIAEAYSRGRPVRGHLDLADLERHLAEIRPRRVVLTHLSPAMLAQADTLPCDVARDGMTVAL